ncbi:MAG: ion transporter [Kiloniellales bacterium]|nr:ion transporter [Kiloniellales bacterium]
MAARTVTGRLKALIEAQATQNFIIAVIVINAIVIGLETSPSIMARVGALLIFLDVAALCIFVVEIAIKLFVYRWSFFRSPWNLFDFVIVGIALVPASEGMSVLRALRILRALRLLSMVPKMRTVIEALLRAIPGLSSVIGLLLLVFYIFAVMATKLFGAEFDAWFGTVGRSFFSLFQIMTLESWSMGIVRPVMDVFPYAWVFFVAFILSTTFAVLNLFIAIIVNSMHEAAEQEADAQGANMQPVLDELQALRGEIAELRRERGGASTREQQ